MPSFGLEVPHQIGREGAIERLSAFLEKVRKRYGSQVSNLEESWENNCLTFSFRTYGFDIKGTVEIAEDTVRLSGELPFAAMMFRGRIEQTIREELERVLA